MHINSAKQQKQKQNSDGILFLCLIFQSPAWLMTRSACLKSSAIESLNRNTSRLMCGQLPEAGTYDPLPTWSTKRSYPRVLKVWESKEDDVSMRNTSELYLVYSTMSTEWKLQWKTVWRIQVTWRVLSKVWGIQRVRGQKETIVTWTFSDDVMFSMSSSKLVVPTVTNTVFMAHNDTCRKSRVWKSVNCFFFSLKRTVPLAVYLSVSAEVLCYYHLLPGNVISPAIRTLTNGKCNNIRVKKISNYLLFCYCRKNQCGGICVEKIIAFYILWIWRLF